jgi:proline iminopeptidase
MTWSRFKTHLSHHAMLGGLRIQTLLTLTVALAFGAFTPVRGAPPTLPAGDYVTVAGAKLWYISEGKGEPLVIISGGPGAAHYLYPWMSALADSYRVIYLDAYGTGKSDRAKTPAGYTLTRYVEEIEGLRQALGLGKIHLFGHSFGTVVVQDFALRHPDALRSLILACPLSSGEALQATNNHANELVRQHFPEIWTRIAALRARGLHETDMELAAVMQEIPETLFYYANIANAGKMNIDFNPDVGIGLLGPDPDFTVTGDMARFDFRPKLATLPMPLLVIAARYDRIVSAHLTLDYQKWAPQATFVMLENSGHNLFVEENEKFVQTLRTFLTARPPMPGPARATK